MYVKYIEQCLAHESCYKLNIKKHEDHGIWSYHSWQIKGEKEKQWQIIFSEAPESLQMVTAAMELKDTCSLEGKLWQT